MRPDGKRQEQKGTRSRAIDGLAGQDIVSGRLSVAIMPLRVVAIAAFADEEALIVPLAPALILLSLPSNTRS